MVIPIQKYLRTGLLVDTNLLLLLVIGIMNPGLLGPNGFKRVRQYSTEDFDLLRIFVNRFRKLATTPHLLAEVNDLGNNLPARNKPEFYETFRQLASLVHEIRTPCVEICALESFSKFGFCDAAVENGARQEFLVLTDDAPLSGFLKSRAMDVLNFNYLRFEDHV